MIEDYTQTGDYKTFYKIFGEDAKDTPTIVLHGGPGSAHNYTLGLAKLGEMKHKVIFYDQVGSVYSKYDFKDGEMGFEIFIDQLEKLRDNLELKEVNLIGHSWGGMLIIEYLIRAAEKGIDTGVKKAVLSSAMFSMPRYEKSIQPLVDALSDGTKTAIKKAVDNKTPTDIEFLDAHHEYDNRHIYRSEIWPELYRVPKGFYNYSLYNHMWGTSESYVADGSLYMWDREEDLKSINVPTLITCGEFDELTPDEAMVCANEIPDSRIKVFSGASHCHHVESEEEYLKTIDHFLNE